MLLVTVTPWVLNANVAVDANSECAEVPQSITPVDVVPETPVIGSAPARVIPLYIFDVIGDIGKLSLVGFDNTSYVSSDTTAIISLFDPNTALTLYFLAEDPSATLYS